MPADCATTATRHSSPCSSRRASSRPRPTPSPRSSSPPCSSPAPKATCPPQSRPTPSAPWSTRRCAARRKAGPRPSSSTSAATATSTSEPTRTTCPGPSSMPDLATAHLHRPDALGHFGPWGGRFVPEVLMAALDELTTAFDEAMADPAFVAELDDLRRSYAGRPTPLTPARRLSQALGLDIWLKREDLLHTGAHKLNNSLGQHLLTRRMGKPRVIAETGAGQHGVATATVAALLGQECVVYMGEEDTRRQHLNVVRMRLLGTEVRPVATGTATLKDAINEALRDWVASVETTHYAIGSVVGPHPFPLLVREFQRVIGEEARA